MTRPRALRSMRFSRTIFSSSVILTDQRTPYRYDPERFQERCHDNRRMRGRDQSRCSSPLYRPPSRTPTRLPSRGGRSRGPSARPIPRRAERRKGRQWARPQRDQPSSRPARKDHSAEQSIDFLNPLRFIMPKNPECSLKCKRGSRRIPTPSAVRNRGALAMRGRRRIHATPARHARQTNDERSELHNRTIWMSVFMRINIGYEPDLLSLRMQNAFTVRHSPHPAGNDISFEPNSANSASFMVAGTQDKARRSFLRLKITANCTV